MTPREPDPLNVGPLEGRWVRLEPLASAHVDQLSAAANEDRAHYGYTPVPSTREEMAHYVEDLLARRTARECVPFAQIARDSARVVGATRYLTLCARRDGDPPYSLEIGGTWLAHSAQRSAINTEAKLLLLRHAFEVLGVARVQLKSDERNERSRRAIERLGARFEGVLAQFQPSAVASEEGLLRNTAMYSIIAEQWPGVRDALGARLARGA